MARQRIDLQFPLVSLFGVVVVVALACAALVNASPLWASTWYTLTLLLLLVATLAALLRPGHRAFWLGFALFGWAYLFFTFGPWAGQFVAPPLLSAQGLAYLESQLREEDGPEVSFSADGRLLVTGTGSGTMRIWDAATRQPLTKWDLALGRPFHQIGHSVVSLALALVGGILACWLRGRPAAPADSEVPRP